MSHIATKIFTVSILTMIPIVSLYSDIFKNHYLNQILLFSLPLLWPGLAHGSLDIAIAKKNRIIKSKLETFGFIIVYISIPICFFTFWIYFPEILLVTFLSLSILHFGISDSVSQTGRIKIVEVLIRGIIVICLPLKFYPNETIQIFSFFLVNEEFLRALSIHVDFAYYFLLILMSLWIFTALNSNFKEIKYRKITFEIITLFFCFWFFQPLISFFIYFCFLHSTRHLIDEKDKLNLNLTELIFKTIPMTLITIIFFIIFFLCIKELPDQLNLSYVIVALSSLTIPHILLVNFTKND